jgi:hypothetical protein
MRAIVMLDMPIAPETRSSRAALNGDAIGARRSNLLPSWRRSRTVGQHRAAGMANQALRHRTEHETVERRVIMRSDDDHVRPNVAR